MSVTPSTLLSLPIITTGTEPGVWGSWVNNGLTSYLDNAIAGTVTLTNDGAVTLSNTAGTDTVTNIVSSLTGAGTVSAQFAIIRVTGTLTTAKVLTAPSSSREYIVVNAATGSTVTIKASGQSGVSVAVGETATVYFNGTDYVKSATTTSGSGTVTSVAQTFTGGIVSVGGSPVTTSGTLALTVAGTSGGIPYFSSATAWTSSAALTQYGIVYGGGAGAAPVATAAGTTGQTLIATTSAAPAWGTLGVAGGGTGQTTYAVGDLLYASTTTALSKLADVATGNALISGGVGVAPSYGKIGLTTHVSGTLPVGNGGTNLTTYAVGDIVYASASTTLASLADVATGNALISGGVGVAPSYGKIGLTTHVSGILPIANGGTNASAAGIAAFNNITGYTASGATGTTSTNLVFSTSPTLVTPVLGTPTSGTLSNCTVDGTNSVGYLNIPINSQSAAYTLVLADAGKAILHPSTDANARTFTIPANGSVAYPIGTALTFINMTSQVVTIAITTDTMYLSSAGTTGSRSLAQYGSATAIKMTSTTWLISGSGLT